MTRLRRIFSWVKFLGWVAFWLWSAVTDDPNQPWRMMFSVACFIQVWDRAFNTPTEPTKVEECAGWISCAERMPEKSGEYLCWFGANKVAIGPAIVTYVDEWKAFGRLVSLEKYPNITHWMPLPEPPKVEE